MDYRTDTLKLFGLMFKFRKFGTTLYNCEQLSQGEMSLLTVLNAYDGPYKKEVLPITELSARLKTTQPAVTQLVNRLEAKGLVTRESDPRDRRTVLVRTTSSGSRVFKKEYERALETGQKVVEQLGEEETRTFIVLLQKLLGVETEILKK